MTTTMTLNELTQKIEQGLTEIAERNIKVRHFRETALRMNSKVYYRVKKYQNMIENNQYDD